MQFLPFTFHDFPSYDERIDGIEDIQGIEHNVRIRMVDVPYQEGCIIRLIIPQKTQEGEAPYGGALDPEDETFFREMDRFPVIVHVQGSGWFPQDMHDHIFDLARIAREGYVIAVVQYHGAPEGRFPQQVIDTKRALRFLQANEDKLPINMSRVYLSGDSSGGHTMLLTWLTYESGELDDPGAGALPKLSGGLDFYGVTDFNTFDYWWTRSGEMLEPNVEALLGEGWQDKAVRAKASPTSWVKEGLQLTPLLILHGSKDTIVPFTQSVEMYQQLKTYGYDVRLLRVRGADHGGPIFYSEPVYQEILEFLKAHR